MIGRLRGTVMPISEGIEDHTLEPQLTDAMQQAFRKTCHVLQLKADANDPLTELVVAKIIELAKAGEIDPERLCSLVLISISEQLGGPESGATPDRPTE
jgi:hypothetical protein